MHIHNIVVKFSSGKQRWYRIECNAEECCENSVDFCNSIESFLRRQSRQKLVLSVVHYLGFTEVGIYRKKMFNGQLCYD